MQAGKLRHRIVIQCLSDNVQNPITGDITTDWVDMAKVWARVSPYSGKEYLKSAATQSKTTARITIRYREDVTTKERILHRGKIYNIEAPLEDDNSGLEYLTLLCSEGVNDGSG